MSDTTKPVSNAEFFGQLAAQGEPHVVGATEIEWFHFDTMLGFGQDLLPVVANQNAKISKGSSIKTLGKVPSRYNGRGEVSGFVDWGNHRATYAEIRAWSRQPDYGLKLRTCLDRLQLFKSSSCGFDVELGAQCEMVEFVFDL